MNKINLFIQDYFVSSRTPEVTNFFYLITSAFDFSWVFFILTILISILILKFKSVGYLYLFLCNIFASMTTVYLLKIIFDTERPTNSVIDAFGASFPSYHATISTVFFVSIFYIFKDQIQDSYKKIFGSVSFLMIFLVSFSRVYLGVHWLSDIVFGVVIGLAICYLSIHIFRANYKGL